MATDHGADEIRPEVRDTIQRIAGGGGQGGSPPSTPSNGQDDGDKKKKLRILLFAALFLGCIMATGYAALIVAAYKTTTPEGREHVQKLLEYDERNKVREYDERKRKDEERAARRNERKGQPPVQALASPSCVNASQHVSTRREPITLQSGSCLTRATPTEAGDNFWVMFAAPPKQVIGNASFGEMKKVLNDEGVLVSREVDHCITSQVNDQCLGWLSGKPNIPLTVLNATPLSINM